MDRSPAPGDGRHALIQACKSAATGRVSVNPVQLPFRPKRSPSQLITYAISANAYSQLRQRRRKPRPLPGSRQFGPGCSAYGESAIIIAN